MMVLVSAVSVPFQSVHVVGAFVGSSWWSMSDPSRLGSLFLSRSRVLWGEGVLKKYSMGQCI